MQIKYVGGKERMTDHLYGTNAVWNGKGDVVEVPDEAGKRMAAHYDVWQIVAAAAVRDAAGVPDEVVSEPVAERAEDAAVDPEAAPVRRGPGRPRKNG